MKEELISEISRQLNIMQDSGAESLCKAIYSATGKMALASLWDHPENENFVSIQHFKKRAAKTLAAYLAIYPKAGVYFSEDLSGIIEDIYETYRRNGFFYHSSHRLFSAAPSIGGMEQCTLYRGVPPDQKCCMSGLGLYGVRRDTNPSDKSVAEMFNMQTQPFHVYLQEVLRSNSWSKANWPEDAEFLRIASPFSRGYWKSNPDKTDNISMVRYGFPNKLYAFYRWRDGIFEQKPIPAWRIDDFRTIGQSGSGEYRRIACALLDHIGQLPPILVSFKDWIARIKLGYRLPPAEEDFFKLYSWPINYDVTPKTPQVFQREMSVMVYPILRQHLESIGYRFLEE